MRMGIINFILPFLFVLTPTLIMRGPTLDIIHDVTTALIAVWLMASGFEGWLYGIGRLPWLARGLLLVSAVAFLLPGIATDLAGAGILIAVFLGSKFFANRRSDATA